MAPIVSADVKSLLNIGKAAQFIWRCHSQNCTTSDDHHLGN